MAGARRKISRLKGSFKSMSYDAGKAEKWWSAPQAGDVVWCWTTRVSPPEPGPVQHPALIYRVRYHDSHQGGYKVWLAPGTSQKVEKLFEGDFLIGIPSSDGTRSEILQEKSALVAAGLSKPTKFQLGQLVWIDYNSEFFPSCDRLGKLDLTQEFLRMRLKRVQECDVVKGILLRESTGSR